MARKTGKLTSSAHGSSQGVPFTIDDGTPDDKVYNPVIGGQVMAHGLVPRDYSSYPRRMFRAPPADMPLIPESEWDARFEEQEARQSSLEHVFNRLAQERGVSVPYLHQNGHGYCHKEDTECLTINGWVPWPDYNWVDPLGTVNPLTGLLEYQRPFQRHVYEYDGPLVCSTNRRLDFAVTPDHQMYVRRWNERERTLESQYSFVRAGDLGWYAGMMPAPTGWLGTDFVEVEVPNDRRYDGDDFMAMLGLIVSDGFAGGADSTRNMVSFASFREGSRPAVTALAQRLGFREQANRQGVWLRNTLDSAALAEWVRSKCYTGDGLGARNKCVPDVVKVASTRQIKLFLQWFDDRNRDGSQFYSVSKRLIDDLQELHLRIGKRSSIGKRGSRESFHDGKRIRSSGEYTLTVGEKDQLCVDRKKHIETDRYKGLVYCAAVPNHTLLTRRNGSVLISSNCWMYSGGNAAMLDRAARNMPYVRLNPHAGASIIKGGRDEGGWCGLGAKFLTEVGLPSEEFWKVHSRDLKQDTPQMRANAALHKLMEDWVDLEASVYDRNLTRQQLATCLLSNVPCPTDWDEWGHSVCAGRWYRVEKGVWAPRILNSWLGWGDNGWGTINRRWTVDSALALRVTGVSPA